MKKAVFCAFLILIISIFASCTAIKKTSGSDSTSDSTSNAETETTLTTTETTSVTETETETTTETTTEPKPKHSPLYIEGVDVEDVITWFSEVVLDTEYGGNGSQNLVQKWTEPISYTFDGLPNSTDTDFIKSYIRKLNNIDGFPGLYYTDDDAADVTIHFYGRVLFNIETKRMTEFDTSNGVAQYSFWTDSNEIYKGDVFICLDVPRNQRDSVILEEIYQVLGPTQDTNLREDSVIYQGYADTDHLSDVDWLIMKLLYSDEIHCGMGKKQCAEVIRSLYY